MVVFDWTLALVCSAVVGICVNLSSLTCRRARFSKHVPTDYFCNRANTEQVMRSSHITFLRCNWNTSWPCDERLVFSFFQHKSLHIYSLRIESVRAHCSYRFVQLVNFSVMTFTFESIVTWLSTWVCRLNIYVLFPSCPYFAYQSHLNDWLDEVRSCGTRAHATLMLLC